MKKMKYEQPKLEAIRIAATDILLSSASVAWGDLSEDYGGARGEISYNDVWR